VCDFEHVLFNYFTIPLSIISLKVYHHQRITNHNVIITEHTSSDSDLDHNVVIREPIISLRLCHHQTVT
jgi:hypothetical protein